VSRWDKDDNTVKFVIGRFFELSSYDAYDEISEQQGPLDLRPFQLVEKSQQVKLQYLCEHLADGWLILLNGQPVPGANVVFRTSLFCLDCLSKYTISTSDDGGDQWAAVLEMRRTRLWENRRLDGIGDYVMPAFDHSQTLEDAASRFYTAYPGRKQFHPESVGFLLQLKGWSGEDIAVKKWLCDCTGCRAMPKTLGCKKYPEPR
jgi:hypothetical protein